MVAQEVLHIYLGGNRSISADIQEMGRMLFKVVFNAYISLSFFSFATLFCFLMFV